MIIKWQTKCQLEQDRASIRPTLTAKPASQLAFLLPSRELLRVPEPS